MHPALSSVHADFDAFFATATFLMRKRRRKLGERGGPAVLVTAYQHRSGHRCLEWLLDRWVSAHGGEHEHLRKPRSPVAR